MGSFSVLGIIVAVGAVVAAYCMGYSSGRTVGRDEGFDEGKQKGSREGSMRAYAVGFDRGKRARAGNKDGDSGNATANLGIAIFALMLGLLLFLWHSSSTDRVSALAVTVQRTSARKLETQSVAELAVGAD